MTTMFGRRAPPAAGAAGVAVDGAEVWAGLWAGVWAWASCTPPLAAATTAALPPSSIPRRERPLLIACRFLSASGLVAEHAAEADMAHASVHHLRVARRRPVAA